MQELTRFDQQLGGTMQMVVTHLRLGYPNPDDLRKTGPNPASTVSKTGLDPDVRAQINILRQMVAPVMPGR